MGKHREQMTVSEIERLHAAFKECTGVEKDNRLVKGGEMFFGLKGENFDGNDYALAALDAGARYAVVSRDSGAALSGDSRVIAVPDTLEALQQLARYHRENTFVDGKRLTAIGLTGTNGKTTTKELVTSVLSVKYRVTSTRGNLNNDIGVPLSLLSIDSDTQIAVIEMGASHPDDIEKLVKVCEPDFGLITNVGRAHLLGFGSFEGVKRAKGSLYDYLAEHGGEIFLNADDPVLAEMASERKGLIINEYGIRFWGGEALPPSAENPYLSIRLPECSIATHLSGTYNADNVAAALAVGLRFGIPVTDAAKAISEYVPVNNRSQILRTDSNMLIVDAYNANPSSMAAALDNLDSVVAEHKAALLGDMRELGSESLAEHESILRKLDSMNLDLVCLAGEEFGRAVSSMGNKKGFRCFSDSDSLAEWLSDNPLKGFTVLVKGSRGIRMEKVIPSL